MNTEEDIKVKVIIPFLESLGFEISELELEKSFQIKLGTYAIRVDTEKQIHRASSRLDILVKKNGNPLFVIEAKTDSHSITDDDKEQAICYARLVHPIAPLAIVTNGKDSRAYNTITKEQIDNKSINGYQADLSGDMEKAYEEAFEYFISYSEENVRTFCKTQLAEHMKTLLGSKEKLDRKFIPELYVRSKKLYNAFAAFLKSDKPVFALVGESGIGKTCAMCGLAQDLSYPVLFYTAQQLRGELTKAISDDFNWQFSSYQDDIPLLKKLDRLFKDTKLIIFIDGVDEWTNSEKVAILGNFASKIKTRNFKLVISCKSGQWPKFLTSRSNPTDLSEEIFSIKEGFPKGYFIEPFDQEEFFELVKKYRAFYDFEGLFEHSVLEECKRLPFLLRVFFEVAHKTKKDHLTFSTKEFFEEYYKAIIAKLPGDEEKRSLAERIIKAVAGSLFEKNIEAISESTLRKTLNLGITQELPILSLFEHNILEKSSDESETRIGFYFKKIRDYIIAFKVNQWNTLSAEEFKSAIENLKLCDVQFDVLSLFYRLADVEKKEVIDGPVRSNALAYLELYSKILDTHFYNLKHRFRPHTKGRIGFIGNFDIKEKRIGMHGFRTIEKGDEKIKLLPVERLFESNNLFYIEGGGRSHYSTSVDGFNDIDIKKEVLHDEISSQLDEIITKGTLNEENNYYLALEKTLGLVAKYQTDIHGIQKPHLLSRYLPIEIEKVEYGLRYRQAYHYYDRQLIKKKIKDDVIKPTWHGSRRSYNYSYSEEDRQILRRQAAGVASSKLELADKVTDVDIKKLTSILNEALLTVKKRKNIIDEVIVPDHDTLPTGSVVYGWEYFKKDTLISFLHRIHTLYLDEYKTLVETNFPTFKEQFKLYSNMPVYYFVVPNLDEHQQDGWRNGIECYVCKNTDNEKNEVIFWKEDEITFNRSRFLVTYKQKEYNVLWVEKSSLRTFFFPSYNYLDGNIHSDFTALRSLVYEQIRQEIPKAKENLFQLYNVS